MTDKNNSTATVGSDLLSAEDYVHLHNHTHYSLLDGLQKINLMVSKVAELGMNAVAVTDHGTLSGTIEFYKEAKSKNIRPIIGMETYVAKRGFKDKEPTTDKQNYHLILLAMNNVGYQNLMRLSTMANLEGFYYKPRIDHELLEKYNEGLIVLSACIGGEVGDALRQGQYEQAKEIASWYKKVFGDRYYLEVQDHGHPSHPSVWDEQVRVNELLFTLSGELDIPCVVTCDAHYLTHEDQEAHEILLCVQTGSFIDDAGRMSLKNFELHMTEPNELIARWGQDHPEVIKNSSTIAERCNVDIELGKILLPKFPVPNGKDEKSYLEDCVYQGLAWRYGGVEEQASKKLTIEQAKKVIEKEVLERASYELGVVDQMGFNGYFLIIADFMGWGKNNGIVFGPGRGSAAGSIIAYSLKITELDPLKYNLLFERFLNPDRVSMPDVDIDIQDTRRDEVIQYCVEKYGENRVANIVTFGKMAARNAVRDVARVLRVPYSEADRIAKMIPPPVQGRHIPLEQSLIENTELANEKKNNPDAKRVFDLAVKLEGTIRSHGVHAAGVVIAPDDIVKFVPLEMAQKGVIATQYSMGPIDDLGLLKMDFLGLSNLTIIKNALRIIKKVKGVDIDINAIPLDDAKTFELLQKGETTGVFQLESPGMKRYLKDLKPTSFDDIVAMVALYRPGPMQWIDDFIARKHGTKDIVFMHEAMEPALRDTYGVIVYQEQVMQISKELSGFTGGQADTLRKAIGKKNPEVMKKLKKDFIDGAVSKVGADKSMMEKLWKQLEDFAAYCFNKSHAACYGLIAYQTAYLKAHHPESFMAALMTSDFDDIDRLSIEITECQNMGIQVLPPDVNASFLEFGIDKEKPEIRFGLSAIKNVGTGAVDEIVRARTEGSNFKGLEDFFNRVNVKVVNRKALESLIKAGAMDEFGERGLLLNNLDLLLAYASKRQKESSSGQIDLFGNATSSEQTVSAKLQLVGKEGVYTEAEILQWERDLMGIYLSSNPLQSYRAYLDEFAVPLSEIKKEHQDSKVSIGGIITDIRTITTKNGKYMSFVKLSDEIKQIEIVVFPKVFEEASSIIHKDKVIIAIGKIDFVGRDGSIEDEPKIILDRVREVTQDTLSRFVPSEKKAEIGATSKSKKAVKTAMKTKTPMDKRVYIRLFDTADTKKLTQLKSVIAENSGDIEVVLVVGEIDNKQAIRVPEKINASEVVIKKLETIFGTENIKV